MIRKGGVGGMVKTKEFGKALVEFKGDKYMAYHKVYGDKKYKGQHISQLMKNEVVQGSMRECLARRGIDEEYLVGKFKELLEGGSEQMQGRMLELGLKMLGHLDSKQDTRTSLTQVNYNINSDNLDAAVDKMSRMANRLGVVDVECE